MNIYTYIYTYIYTSLSAVQIYDFHIFLTVYSIFCRSHSTWALRKRKFKSLWYARVLNDNIFNVSWSENLSYSICTTYHRSFVPSAVGEHHPMVSANFPPVPLTLRRHYCGQVTKFIFFDQNGEFKHIIHM